MVNLLANCEKLAFLTPENGVFFKTVIVLYLFCIKGYSRFAVSAGKACLGCLIIAQKIMNKMNVLFVMRQKWKFAWRKWV
ncbi:hypothetical protein TH25_19655 [Thalassospira profundimaris]|uniref:Uncharacterized protein n=1 Tax=Thalassospira profundimaris TaxID=502049 RepID=A0A367WVD9_9PROT|nr:hypothetical protein TH25_19655 [Thalassospira profundimaris]